MTSRRAAELIAVILAALVGIFVPATAEATAVQMLGTTATTAAPYTYDGFTISRVDVYAPDGAAGAAPQLSDVREGSASTAAADARASTTSLRSFIATNTVDDLLPGLPAGAPKPLGLGSTGRVAPGNLTEQLAMTEVRAAPAGRQLGVTMTDARWPAADGWVKMSQNVNGVEIHYVQNTITGAVDDFKFIGGAG